MTEKGSFERGPRELTPELIKGQTDFELVAIFPDFAELNGRVSPELHDERERLSAEHGEHNVLPSLFTDENGVVQLGLFVRDHTNALYPDSNALSY